MKEEDFDDHPVPEYDTVFREEEEVCLKAIFVKIACSVN
jgi:hypothetical protein